ncbi:MAG: rRNA methyltransferase [Hamadaea sp.]|nr:rRNA methyltransferase [Hamadaea sp.]NUR48947.1 rRNA methyltransferase [Hamadaea sp.]NUT02442.1 rRNA methyltransferase [Hamadaea sp.]
MPDLRITSRNARFQQWSALLTNRTKRHRAGEFLVQGVRPISQAIEHGWAVRALVYDLDAQLSHWATDLLDTVRAPAVAMAPELLAELGGKEEDAPELIAVVAQRPDDFRRIQPAPGRPAVVFDRPTSPGNIGTLIRSADAFGAAGVIVTGHAADPYDPKAVRASTGSFFAVPVVRAPSHREVLEWAASQSLAVAGTDETGDVDVAEYGYEQPTLLVIGNETAGMSAGWREACDTVLSIPMIGTASSLNAATAGSIALYEAARARSRS